MTEKSHITEHLNSRRGSRLRNGNRHCFCPLPTLWHIWKYTLGTFILKIIKNAFITSIHWSTLEEIWFARMTWQQFTKLPKKTVKGQNICVDFWRSFAVFPHTCKRCLCVYVGYWFQWLHKDLPNSKMKFNVQNYLLTAEMYISHSTSIFKSLL